MWVPSTWKTEDDVLKDLQILSEVPPPADKSQIKVPNTILKYRKQMEENKLCTLNGDIDETASYIVSGRGRGIRDRVILPGGIVDCDPSDDTALKKQIRQVAGFGYSNGLIEQSIRAKCYDPGTSSNVNGNFKFVSKSSNSSSSSESRSGRKKHNDESSADSYKDEIN